MKHSTNHIQKQHYNLIKGIKHGMHKTIFNSRIRNKINFRVNFIKIFYRQMLNSSLATAKLANLKIYTSQKMYRQVQINMKVCETLRVDLIIYCKHIPKHENSMPDFQYINPRNLLDLFHTILMLTGN